jgi:hypothetical protein
VRRPLAAGRAIRSTTAGSATASGTRQPLLRRPRRRPAAGRGAGATLREKNAGRQRLPAPYRSFAVVLVRSAWSFLRRRMAPARVPPPPQKERWGVGGAASPHPSLQLEPTRASLERPSPSLPGSFSAPSPRRRSCRLVGSRPFWRCSRSAGAMRSCWSPSRPSGNVLGSW